VVSWDEHKAHREKVAALHGQWVGLVDKDWVPLMDVEDWLSAEWPSVFADTGSMSMVLPGELDGGVRNPVVDYLLTNDLQRLDEAASLDALLHSAVHIVVERPGLDRRCYRILEIVPEGGVDNPATVTITGVDLIEHLKHLPLWANPSNRSKVVQAQWQDTQDGPAEKVSRKLIGRNLIGYFQPSMLRDSRWMTDGYSKTARWSDLQPNMHPIICSPIMSGNDSEWCEISARWDNAWDLCKGTWDAAGILPIAKLWWPGDAQPFPSHATLQLPTVVIDFSPRATVTGAAGFIGQGLRHIKRTISSDDYITSVVNFSDVGLRQRDGRDPWVVYTLPEGPEVRIRKSTDHRFLVGGKAPDLVNKTAKVAVKSGFAALIAAVPGIGPPTEEAIKGAGELAAELTADRLLSLNEYVDKDRQAHYGRSAFVSLAKPGEANSMESLQKAWGAKMETQGGVSIQFTLDDPDPYLPGRDFDLGDTIGFTSWGVMYAAYVSELTWVSEPGCPVGWKLTVGDLAALQNPEALFASNLEQVRAVIGRLNLSKQA